MSLFELFVLAVGLCMDSFAVSLTSGVLLKPFTLSRVLKIAAFMAVFQGAMPLIGWFLGIGFKNYRSLRSLGSIRSFTLFGSENDL